MELDESTKPLAILARRPSRYAKSHKGYLVKGYKFHTRSHGEGRMTNNYGVCVRGTTYVDEESDYYGLLDEVLEVEFYDKGLSNVVMFKCTWFDNDHGVRVNKNKLVDVKHKSRLQTDDPFVLASQVEQVYYTPYPAVTKDTKNWWAVVKTKPRGVYDVGGQFFQIDERFEYTDEVSNNERMCLVTDGEFQEFEDEEMDHDQDEDEDEESEEGEQETSDEEEEEEEFEDTDESEDEIEFSDHLSDTDTGDDEDQLDS